MTPRIEPDGYCEDCGQPVWDEINGNCYDECAVVICAACRNDQEAAIEAAIYGDIDEMYAQHAYQRHMAAVDDMPAAGSF